MAQGKKRGAVSRDELRYELSLMEIPGQIDELPERLRPMAQMLYEMSREDRDVVLSLYRDLMADRG